MTFDNLQQRHAAITELCRARELEPARVAALGGSERWATYRHMVRTRLFGMVRAGLPRTFATLEPVCADALLANWLATAGFQSAYIRDVVGSFFDATDWQAVAETPEKPWLPDLARYEATLWELRHRETKDIAVVDFAFDARPAISAATETLTLDYPVFRKKLTHFEPEQKHVLLFRHQLTDKVGYLTLTDFQRALFSQMRVGTAPMTNCVQQAAQELTLSIDEALLEAISSFLADLMTRTVLTGSLKAA